MAMIFRQPGKTGIGIKADDSVGLKNGKNCHRISSNERTRKMKVNSIIFCLYAGLSSSIVMNNAFSMDHYNGIGLEEQNRDQGYDNMIMDLSMSVSEEDVDEYNENNLDFNIPDSIRDIHGIEEEDAMEDCSPYRIWHVDDFINEQSIEECDKVSLVFNGDFTKLPRKIISKIRKSLAEVVMLTSPRAIKDYMFHNCVSLQNVTIPEGVSSIGSNAFSGCCSLARIVIPNSVTSIGEYAFEDCTNLQFIEMPRGVTSIDLSIFTGCDGARTIVVQDNIQEIINVNCSKLLGLGDNDFSVRCTDGNLNQEMVHRICMVMNKSKVKHFNFIAPNDDIIAICRKLDNKFIITDSTGRQIATCFFNKNWEWELDWLLDNDNM